MNQPRFRKKIVPQNGPVCLDVYNTPRRGKLNIFRKMGCGINWSSRERRATRSIGDGCFMRSKMARTWSVSDHVQSDKDANDNKGTDKVDFEWMIGNRVLNSNGIIDEVISESVPEPTALLLLALGLTGLGGLRRRFQQ
jgi:hypothetical protein